MFLFEHLTRAGLTYSLTVSFIFTELETNLVSVIYFLHFEDLSFKKPKTLPLKYNSDLHNETFKWI